MYGNPSGGKASLVMATKVLYGNPTGGKATLVLAIPAVYGNPTSGNPSENTCRGREMDPQCSFELAAGRGGGGRGEEGSIRTRDGKM
jgi:hypothetical protein